MIRKIIMMAAFVAIPLIVPFQAQAQSAKGDDYCREYVKDVNINGKAERAHGTACLRPDGSWEIVRLEGSSYGRDRVRETIREDIKSHAKRKDYDSKDRIVIVKSAHSPRYYSPRYYKKRHYNHVGYGNRGFGVHFGNGYGYHNNKYYSHGKRFKHHGKRYSRSHHGKKFHHKKH